MLTKKWLYLLMKSIEAIAEETEIDNLFGLLIQSWVIIIAGPLIIMADIVTLPVQLIYIMLIIKNKKI